VSTKALASDFMVTDWKSSPCSAKDEDVRCPHFHSTLVYRPNQCNKMRKRNKGTWIKNIRTVKQHKHMYQILRIHQKTATRRNKCI
jgi:hypothetical protein